MSLFALGYNDFAVYLPILPGCSGWSVLVYALYRAGVRFKVHGPRERVESAFSSSLGEFGETP